VARGISWWTNADAIRRFAGEGMDTARYFPEDDRFLLTRPDSVQHYDSHAFDVRHDQAVFHFLTDQADRSV
jgi:hypothetical protein